MRTVCIFIAALCVGCTPPAPPGTVTVTKTVAVYPPASLYGPDDGCKHGAAHTTGTVADLAYALVDERAAVDVCLGDRAALRKWRADNEAK